MASLNKVMLIGHLGKDPELRYTPSGMPVAKFSMATTERRKNKAGEYEDHTEWHNIVLFGKNAENAGNYLHKGKQVYVEGKISTNKWQDDQGNNKYFTEIIGSYFLMMGRKGDSSAPGGSGDYSQYDNMAPDEDDDDDIPF